MTADPLPETEIVNVGELLDDLARALAAMANSLTPAGAIVDSQMAFRNIAAVTGRMAAAFAHVQIAVPVEEAERG